MVDTIRPLFGCHRRFRGKASETTVAIDDPEIAPGETRRVVALALSAALNAPIPEPRFGVFRM